jgi:uncharacterized protein
MSMPTVTIELPADFLRDAADFGLTSPTEILTVLRDELDRRIYEFVEVEIQAHQFARFLERNGLTPDLFMEELASFAVVINPADITPTVLADPDDDAVLVCALGGLADFIVTGDYHLLNLKRYHHIQIVSVHEFLTLANPFPLGA